MQRVSIKCCVRTAGTQRSQRKKLYDVQESVGAAHRSETSVGGGFFLMIRRPPRSTQSCLKYAEQGFKEITYSICISHHK